MLRGTPVISAGFQANTSKFCLSRVHSSLRPFSVRGRVAWSGDQCTLDWYDPAAVVNVTVPSFTRNFSIPMGLRGWYDTIFLIPACLLFPCGMDGDLTTMKFSPCEVNSLTSPIFTSKDIWPQAAKMVSPLKSS
ncbi:hypothetical protein Tco_0821759 [Tanacetum coccineum]|uniref:Uncharacterized protein n=1 Tax=Tanacetum coccineum TaxID=301880 RepID=A0ABQ5AD58_9ASTR